MAALRRHGSGSATPTVTSVQLGTAAEAGRNIVGAKEVEVLSRSGSDPIFFTVNGDAPTVGGDDTYVCQASGFVRVDGPDGAFPITVKMISASAFTYSLEALPG